ncbi:MAG TPA: hypothetical protein P5548_01690 [Candidatus Moranbacteria bacterium]|nr:hypothetical protein [Candidatus Moranbacteria bacterium]HRZ33594.1 hypothetical protein [Candidatus Moranbacteria bacterium]
MKKFFLIIPIALFLFWGLSNTTQAAIMEYKLLQGIPGFYDAGAKVESFPDLILAIYKFGIWTVGIAGLFMITIGGFWYMTSAGNTARAETAKQLIADSLLGIVAAMSAYLIVYVINPDLTNINIAFVPVIIEEGAEDEDAISPGPTPAPTPRDIAQSKSRNTKPLSQPFIEALDYANSKGVKTIVTSGIRTFEEQKALVIQNCGSYPTTKRSSQCRIPTNTLKNGRDSLKRCPHCVGAAADIWVAKGGAQVIYQKQCLKDIGNCKRIQKPLIDAMKEKGFCVLASEPWHFEKPKMSSACN